jgi:5-methylcytosine-specific restriction endonuclease McrA
MKLGYPVFARVRERIASDHNWVCLYCGTNVSVGRDVGDQLATIDHKIPLSRGGSWKRFNLTCACRRCNSEKGNMTADEYMDCRRAMMQCQQG